MRKIYLLILTLTILLFSLISCSKNESVVDNKETDKKQVEQKLENKDNDLKFEFEADDYVNPDPNYKKAKGFLYEVINKETGNKVNLLGSIHVYDKKYYPLSDNIMNAYNESKTVSFEILPLDVSDTLKIINIMTLKDNTLKDLLDIETGMKLEKVIQKLDINPDLLKTVQPIFASTNIETILMTKYGFDPEIGIDNYFTRKAIRDSKEIFAIEGAVNQIEMLSSISKETQVELLKSTLDSVLSENNEENELNLVDIWYQGDEEAIVKLSEGDLFEKLPEYKEKLLTLRDKGMYDYIVEKLNTGKDNIDMVIVGALHVSSKDGLVKMLKSSGYDVIRK